MRQALKAKSTFTDADVAEVWGSISDYVTADEAEQAVDEAAREVRSVVGSRLADVVYGWSGGKDSIALQAVMERAGVHRSVCGIIPHLEFRQYLDWIEGHQPNGLTMIGNPKPTLRWLADNQRYVFPANARDGYFWTLASARHAQRRYQAEHGPALQIYGRRTQDGNICGGKDGIHQSRSLTAYNPLRSWPHEMILAVVHYSGKQLPPVYGWPHGWSAGTGSWPGRRVGTVTESWAETYAIEPDRVREAAEHIPSARAWLESVT
jgi:3'-phosphoadenosine 5'-phosphosulfate sulfotransferase (PAPS reductase)/FAD synthetase